ncbi:hypothetical protein E3N88_10782 [Mikania micrantha]|uniref:Uncharacterized protein n=1 Tax=Mikania micrantha TaxID=192012 RepID=A0A5N6PBI0_9ASTR|nr:hypothetical protein E3N88_10782 [Mikania micrantha]
METGTVGFIQQALKGFLKCLGLEGDGGKTLGVGEEVVNNPSPPQSPPHESQPTADHTSTAVDPPVDVLSLPVSKVVKNPSPPQSPPHESQPAADHTSTAVDPPVDVLSLPIESPTRRTTDTNNDLGADTSVNLVTIDDLINTSSGGITTDAHHAELLVGGQPNMTSLLTTSLISSGGGGKTH